MKKIFVCSMAVLMSVGAASAGFVDKNETVVTVAQVKEMRDDVPVIVSGQIVKNMGDEKYLFRDATDSIIIEIDDEDWGGLNVTPDDTVKLYGEVESKLFKTEIDVDKIEKL